MGEIYILKPENGGLQLVPVIDRHFVLRTDSRLILCIETTMDGSSGSVPARNLNNVRIYICMGLPLEICDLSLNDLTS